MDEELEVIKKYLKIRSNHISIEAIDKDTIKNLYDIKQKSDGYSIYVFPFAGKNFITKKINTILFTSYLIIPTINNSKTIVRKIHSTKFLMGIIKMKMGTLKMGIEGRFHDIYLEKPMFYHYLLMSIYALFSLAIIRKVIIAHDRILVTMPFIIIYSTLYIWLHETKELVLYPIISIIVFILLTITYFMV